MDLLGTCQGRWITTVTRGGFLLVQEQREGNMKVPSACLHSIYFPILPTFLKEEHAYHMSQNYLEYALQLWVPEPHYSSSRLSEPQVNYSGGVEIDVLKRRLFELWNSMTL